ncbi:hypothetical protein GJU39_16680 [Pedobacter petrophilus]|uniref:Uncharacterized protein n=1 Tax=Pedobacter petrophilus TaxID=1908241 RepID=A0A7K0G2X5_9SPHI|nr:hypothetical protein [Pedobacter petrophilus]MRX77724.1 hypothetical protein [Pedobacter petrophilus]
MNTGKTNLASLSIDELYFKKKEYKNDVLGLGLLMLAVGLTTIILSIIAKNYALIAVGVLGLEPGVRNLTRLNQVNKAIKSRYAA